MNAFSSSDTALYEVHSPAWETEFVATLFHHASGDWAEKFSFSSDLKRDVSFFAIDYFNLSAPKLAFQSGTSTSNRVDSIEDSVSRYGEYAWTYAIDGSVSVSAEETPLVAYRRFGIHGEPQGGKS